MPHDCSITLHRQTCLHCGHKSEFATYIVRTGPNRFNYDIKSFPDARVTTLFHNDYPVPRCVRCVDRGLPSAWPTYHRHPDETAELQLDAPVKASSRNFQRWKSSKPSSPAFDPLAELDKLNKGAPPSPPLPNLLLPPLSTVPPASSTATSATGPADTAATAPSSPIPATTASTTSTSASPPQIAASIGRQLAVTHHEVVQCPSTPDAPTAASATSTPTPTSTIPNESSDTSPAADTLPPEPISTSIPLTGVENTNPTSPPLPPTKN